MIKRCSTAIIFLIASMIFPYFAEAKHSNQMQNTLTEELLYEGKPIEAVCFHDLLKLSEGQSISLKDCKKPEHALQKALHGTTSPTYISTTHVPCDASHSIHIDATHSECGDIPQYAKALTKHPVYNDHQALEHLPKGTIGYHYYLYGNTCDDKEAGNCEHRFAAYKYLGKVDDKPVLLVADERRREWYGDGDRYEVMLSGLSLIQIQRNGDAINLVKNFSSSLGIDGRIQDTAKIENGKIHFETDVCPSDFARLAGDSEDIDKLLKYGDDRVFHSNESCDYATFETDKLKAIHLRYYSRDKTQNYSDLPMQKCFDAVHNDYLHKVMKTNTYKQMKPPYLHFPDVVLDEALLQTFIHDMKDGCKTSNE